MKRLPAQKMLLCLAMLFAMQGLSSHALAQIAHDINVLGRPEVRDHLIADFDLSKKDAEKLKTITLGLVRQVGSLKRDLRVKKVQLSEEDFVDTSTECTETIQTLNQESWAEATEILSEKQVARIKQLRVQFIGSDAYLDSTLAESIGLREEQLAEIKAAIEAQETKIAELKLTQREKVKGARANRRLMIELNNANREELTELGIAFENSLQEMLDEQQQATLDDMRGEAFEFSPIGR